VHRRHGQWLHPRNDPLLCVQTRNQGNLILILIFLKCDWVLVLIKVLTCSTDFRDDAVLAWSLMSACSLRSVMAVCFLTR
jgi:hypothetical protein